MQALPVQQIEDLGEALIDPSATADLDNLVTLTLLEYEDWPEPEQALLRQLIQPGMRLLDADTGLGLEALAMARCLNGVGQVTAHNTI